MLILVAVIVVAYWLGYSHGRRSTVYIGDYKTTGADYWNHFDSYGRLEDERVGDEP